MEGWVSAATAAMNTRGIPGSLVVHQGNLYWRGYFTDEAGKTAQRRVPLKLKAHESHLFTAEKRVMQLAELVGELGVLPAELPWGRKAQQVQVHALSPVSPLKVVQGVELLEAAFWQGKTRSSQSQRSWARLRTELNRLPAEAKLTTDLLVAVASQLPEGSRSRLEACKTYKRMGKLAGLQGLEALDALKTPYEPMPRDIPPDEALLGFLDVSRTHPRWGWCTAALVVYGCRPAEVFSLCPDTNGTAQCLTLKRKQQGGRSGMPVWRTALALPSEWVARFDLLNVSRPWDVTSPREYDSQEAKRLTEQWGRWVRLRSPGLNLYDLRHAWAIRSIHAVPNASMAAKCMGHSLEVHHRAYHRWLDQSDVAMFAANLKSKTSLS